VTEAKSPDWAKARFREADAKPRSGGRSQIGAGTSEIRRMLIGRELYSESM
jgi:hypothetical protein